MLRITKILSRQDVTLRLDGRLTGQWVELLRETAESVLGEELGLIVDLKNIGFIDCDGVALMKSLINRGVQHVNAPLFVADQISKCKGLQEY